MTPAALILACAVAGASALHAPRTIRRRRLGGGPALAGYYSWNWGKGSTGPSGANIGVAFTGLINGWFLRCLYSHLTPDADRPSHFMEYMQSSLRSPLTHLARPGVAQL